MPDNIDDIDEILATATLAITRSNELLRRNSRNGLPYETKEDLSPVTSVDKEIEEILRTIISMRHPSHRVIGEESGVTGSASSPYSWYLDPIDGTKNFIRGLKFYATQVAVLSGNEAIVGVSDAPALGETVVACKGRGSHMNGQPIHVSGVRKLSDAFVNHGGLRRFHETGRVTQLIELVRACWGARGYGDCWSYHLLAAGKIDVLIEARTKTWDVAAVSLIVEEAGGRVSDLNGLPFSPSSTSILATNGYLHDQVLEIFRT